MRWEVLRYPSLPSTQETARELAARGAPEGTVVRADAQTAGRGRLGRRWFSPPEGGLWFSVILRPFAEAGRRPPLPRDRAPQIGLGAAVAVARAVAGVTGCVPGIKWPNDLLLGGRKFCGILAEAAGGAGGAGFVILGIGIDVNVPPSAFPEDLQSAATSLAAETGRPVPRDELFDRVLEELAAVYRRLRAGDHGGVMAEFARFCIVTGRPVRVQSGAAWWEGVAEGVDSAGALVLRLPDGSERRFHGGEASLRWL